MQTWTPRKTSARTVGSGRPHRCTGEPDAAAASLIVGVEHRVHLFVAEAEVMADFVDENVSHEVRQCDVAALDPFVEDGAAIEKDHWRRRRRIAERALGEIDALIEATEFEWIINAQFGQYVLGGEILDAEDDVAGKPSISPGIRSQAARANISMSSREGAS